MDLYLRPQRQTRRCHVTVDPQVAAPQPVHPVVHDVARVLHKVKAFHPSRGYKYLTSKWVGFDNIPM